MNNQEIQEFIARLKLEREDVQEDLAGLKLANPPMARIGDFGCGWGFTTLSLMLELKPLEGIGVDQFIGNYFFDVPSTENVNSKFDKLRAVLSNESESAYLGIDIPSELIPAFQVGDIVTGVNLPSDLDLAFCKQIFYNVYLDGYASNAIKGKEAVVLAIANVVKSVKADGLICAVEPVNYDIDFKLLFEEVGLRLIQLHPIHRGRISWSGRSGKDIVHGYIYHLAKS